MNDSILYLKYNELLNNKKMEPERDEDIILLNKKNKPGKKK